MSIFLQKRGGGGVCGGVSKSSILASILVTSSGAAKVNREEDQGSEHAKRGKRRAGEMKVQRLEWEE